MHYRPFNSIKHLEIAVDVDKRFPGFLSGLMATRAQKRHAMWAIMSEKPPNPILLYDCLRRPYSEIFNSLFGKIGDGMFGVLYRIPSLDPPKDDDFYRTLYEWFASDDERAKLLTQMGGPISHAKVELIKRLDAAALHPELVKQTFRGSDADRLNGAIALIRNRCSLLTEEVLQSSLRDSHRIHEWVQRMLLKHMNNIPNQTAIPVIEGYRALTTGRCHQEASREMSNCLKDMVFMTALGRNVYYVSDDFQFAVECCCMSQGGLVVTNIWSKRNEPVPETQWNEITSLFHTNGVPAIVLLDRQARAIGRLSRHMIDFIDFQNIAEQEDIDDIAA